MLMALKTPPFLFKRFDNLFDCQWNTTFLRMWRPRDHVHTLANVQSILELTLERETSAESNPAEPNSSRIPKRLEMPAFYIVG